MTRMIAAIVAGLLAAPAFAGGHATGDAEAGAKAFNKCKSCHVIVEEDGTEDGNVIVKGGKSGPNLWNIVNNPLGAADFRYSKLMIAAGEQGLTLDEASFVDYVTDPTAWLTDATGEGGKSKMQKQRVKAEDAVNIWAYLASVSPEPEPTEGEGTDG